MNNTNINFYDTHPGTASLYHEVIRGLASEPKAVPPKFFYDARGSALFNAICKLPEYYPTRTETAILQDAANDLLSLVEPGCQLIELGSGASQKVRLLLDSLRPSAYMAIDISREYLLRATKALSRDFPWLDVHAVCADFSRPMRLPYAPDGVRKLAFFPGSSIGNFEPGDAVNFLAHLRHLLGPLGALLIGVDLKKEPHILDSAYNDERGLTAAFNLNLLERIQRELNSELDPSAFEHEAFYNEREGRVEMHLVSRRNQHVRIDGHRFSFDEGESIHTENSYKYTISEFSELAQRGGFSTKKVWCDERRLFSVHLLRSEN